MRVKRCFKTCLNMARDIYHVKTILSGISLEDYNTALFEAGCLTAENSYPPAEAMTLKRHAGYWKWLREQQKIVDADFLLKIENGELKPGSRKLFCMYYDMLCAHFKKVYLPARLEDKLLEKEVCHG